MPNAEGYLADYLGGLSGLEKAETGDALLDVSGVKRVLNTTFAALPAPSDHIGYANVSDVGLSGSLWQSDGTIWRPVGGRVLLAASAVAAAAVTGGTTEVTTDTLTIKGGIMGLNGGLE